MGVSFVTWWVCLLSCDGRAHTDDLHRVRLLMQPGVNGSDYINASFVDVSDVFNTLAGCYFVWLFTQLHPTNCLQLSVANNANNS